MLQKILLKKNISMPVYHDVVPDYDQLLPNGAGVVISYYHYWTFTIFIFQKPCIVKDRQVDPVRLTFPKIKREEIIIGD